MAGTDWAGNLASNLRAAVFCATVTPGDLDFDEERMSALLASARRRRRIARQGHLRSV